MLVKCLPYVLLGFAAVLPLSMAAATFFLLLAALLFVVLVFEGEMPWKTPLPRVDRALIVFLFIFLLTYVASHPHYGQWGGLRSQYVALLYFLYARFTREEHWFKTIVKTFIFASLVSACLGIVQISLHTWHIPAGFFSKQYSDRAIGFRSHPLTYAEGLLFALALVLPYCVKNISARPWWWRGCAVLLISAIVLSQSRGPWISMFIIFVIFEMVRCHTLPWRTLTVTSGLIALALSTSFPLSQRLVSIPDLKKHESNLARLEIWPTHWEIFRQRPWLGHGGKDIDEEYRKILERRYGLEADTHLTYGESHNLYLQALVKSGILGLCSFLVIFFFVFKDTWHTRTDPDALGLLLGLIGFLVAGLTESVYSDSEIAMTMYFFLGLLASRVGQLSKGKIL